MTNLTVIPGKITSQLPKTELTTEAAQFAEKLLLAIGDIDDFFLQEAETADVAVTKQRRRKKIVKYSVAGIAMSVGIAMAYWKLGGVKGSKAA